MSAARALNRKLAVAVAIAAALCCAPVHADKGSAEKLFRIGQKAYKAGLFADASNALEAAYREWKSADIAFSAAQAHRLHYFTNRAKPSLFRAAELYRAYLDEVKSGGRRADAALNLAELEPILRTVQPETVKPREVTRLGVTASTTKAEISIDNGPFVASPAIAEAKPGQRSYRARAPGHFTKSGTVQVLPGQFAVVELVLSPIPARVEVNVDSGARVYVDGRLAPRPDALQLSPGPHRIEVARRGYQLVTFDRTFVKNTNVSLQPTMERTSRRKIAVGLFAASAATLVAGVGFGIAAADAHYDAEDLDDLRRIRGLSTSERDHYNDRLGARDSRSNTAFILSGAATALAIAGGLVFYFDTPDLTSEVQATLTPTGASLQGRF